MDAILHHFYERLKVGAIVGRKCTQCGEVAFPPRAMCTCGSVAAQWVEVAREGYLISVSVGPYLLTGEQLALATVRLDSGHILSGVLLSSSLNPSRPETAWELTASNPRVQAEPILDENGIPMVAFRLVNDPAPSHD